MKTIGLIGGMSWESSLLYYRTINQQIKHRLGNLHSAKSILYSVDFQEIEEKQRNNQWAELDITMAEAAQSLERAGADFIVLCTNTMHKCASAIERSVKIPLLHIADPTAEKVVASNIQTIGLLGTRFTMEQNFYKNRLTEKFNLSVVTPSKEDQDEVHRIIYQELVLGVCKPESKKKYQQVIDNLTKQGCKGVILGCTEITLLIKPEDVHVPVFDTTEIHALKAVDYALTK